MAFGSFDSRHAQGPMSEINVVPLVDVMLVLLVIFIITAPLLTHAVKVDLPKAASAPNVAPAERVEFAIQADGKMFWNGEATSVDQLATRFATESKKLPQPEVHIRADRLAHYEHIARVMALAARAGLTKIGFVSDPSLQN